VTTVADQAVSSAEELRSSPFPGLVPYTLSDAAYFFGRDEWSGMVIDNLLAYRLSILYGASGIGKSSILSAGALHRLLESERANLARYGAPEHIVAVYRSWTGDPVCGLKEAVAEAVEAISSDLAREPPEGSLPDVLDAWSDRVGGPVLLVLDQFEEYFVYHQPVDGEVAFDNELASAIARRDVQANFLISIREDSLARLDRFDALLPNLLANLIRVEHLDFDDARNVIESAVSRWSSDHGEKIEIEDGLIENVVQDVQTDRVFIGESGRGVTDSADGSGTGSIEAPYLQLVMTRLWDEERRSKSSTLRLATLETLGGVQSIIETHLDQTMSLLSKEDRDVAARVFHYLVTPSGMKIAHSSADLGKYAGVDEATLTPVLTRLAEPDMRVVRLVRPPQPDAPVRYEIFHDVLGAAVLDWRARYIRWRAARRAIAFAFALSAQFVLLIIPFAYIFAADESSASGRVAWLVWAGFAFVWWALTSVLLFRRRRRRARSIWVVPIFDAIAMLLGPLTLVALGVRAVWRRWRSRRRARAAGSPHATG
jgi:hypothetical protein